MDNHHRKAQRVMVWRREGQNTTGPFESQGKTQNNVQPSFIMSVFLSEYMLTSVIFPERLTVKSP